MCGITGFYCPNLNDLEKTIQSMTDAIAHRGPDGEGFWIDEDIGLALGHRRLAVLDLSEAGRQPMMSADGRYVVVFNGEIYNHSAVRAELVAGGVVRQWRGHSDTETMLCALEHWGVEGALKRLNGMFAFALWDRRGRVLSLARDRLGEKPLYYCVSPRGVLFGSELKALARHPEWKGEIDRDALALFLRYGYVPDPWSIYQGVKKLPAGAYLQIPLGGDVGEPQAYWDLREVAVQQRRAVDEATAIAEADAALRRAVGLRMEADVPLGAFLSGGIDSSLVVALMQAQSSRPVKTFTIGFDTPGFNEAEAAKAVAGHLGTDHQELYVTPDDVLALLPCLPDIWNEPFADSSQLPTLLLSRLTREHVTVALSGDGGDEVFGGYNRYGPGWDLYKTLSRLPGPARGIVSAVLERLPAQPIDRMLGHFPIRMRPAAVGDRIEKLASVLKMGSDSDYYRHLVSFNSAPLDLLAGGTEAPSIIARPDEWPTFSDFREAMMYLDSMTYLPGDILTKVDRATMSISLEGRAPFLDHELIEYAWSLPLELKVRQGQTKWILRQVLKRYIPEAMFDRPKMGFGVPIRYWLGGPLRDWAEELLDSGRISQGGMLNAEAVTAMWTRYKQGRFELAQQIWTILMFQYWHSEQTREVA